MCAFVYELTGLRSLGGYMILNEKIAKEVVDVLTRCSSDINETIRLVQDECSDDEFKKYRAAAGLVMGILFTDLREQIYKTHPNLEPKSQ